MKPFAVISDVHANLEALSAVLKDIEREKLDTIFFLGDSVGYGPDPNECTEVLRDRARILLLGNHDLAAAGKSDLTFFNPAAKAAIKWTIEVLSNENTEFLRSLPLTEKIKEYDVFLVHATPEEPGQWHYLTNEYNARINFEYFDERICFLGHSHIPFIAELSSAGEITFHYSYAEIDETSRYIVNAGSVGQPRDGDPGAAYVLFKENSMEIRRVSYDIVITQNKMKKAGLPEDLIYRLSAGR